jgi:hypothetical protein
VNCASIFFASIFSRYVLHEPQHDVPAPEPVRAQEQRRSAAFGDDWS